MIVGNPDKFAIMVDVVNEWNTDNTFNNGVMIFWINSIIFPQELYVTTLNVDVVKVYESLQNIGVDTQIFHMEKNNAFKALYRLVYPTDLDKNNDYRFTITPYEFSDHDHLVFAVSDGKDVRILASSTVYDFEKSTCLLEGICVLETFINIDELNHMIGSIKNGEMKKFLPK